MRSLVAILILLALPLVGVMLGFISCGAAIWVIDPHRPHLLSWLMRRHHR